jgi:L-amino acid N-acyltransferase YncA
LGARPAELRDAPAIAEIYNQGIEDRLATFETEPRMPEAIRCCSTAGGRASPDASGRGVAPREPRFSAMRAFETSLVPYERSRRSTA